MNFEEQEKRERSSLRGEEAAEHWHEFQGKVQHGFQGRRYSQLKAIWYGF
jgi:hypothetical protein